MLPEVRPSAGHVGDVDFGNGKHLPLHALLVDQQAALFGQACFRAGEMKCSFGTGSFLLMNIGDKPKLSNNGLLTTVAGISTATPPMPSMVESRDRLCCPVAERQPESHPRFAVQP